MKNDVVKGNRRARIVAILMTLGLGFSALLIDLGGAPGELHHGLVTCGMTLGAGMLALSSFYCLYLALGAFRSRQFPSPTALVPTDCKVRSDGIAVAAAIFLSAMAGTGLLIFAASIFLRWL